MSNKTIKQAEVDLKLQLSFRIIEEPNLLDNQMKKEKY